MAKLLLGKEVTDALNANLQTRTAALREKGIIPTLGIVRVGADPSDLSYEKGATKRAEWVWMSRSLNCLRMLPRKTFSRSSIRSTPTIPSTAC